MPSSPEQTAIRQVLDGDTEAYRILVERYHQGLIRYLYGMTMDQDEAEDIAQDAFIKAYEKLGQYNPKFAFSTWLYRIASNLCYKRLKQLNMSMALTYDMPDESTQTVAEALDKKHQKKIVKQAVGRLTPKYREVVVLYYWQNMTYEEIAGVTKKPIGTIRTWLFRAKLEVKKELYGRT